jgi:phosphoribosylanthranilate isomerase
MVINFVSVSGISDSAQLSKIHKISLEEKIRFPVTIGYQLSDRSINHGTQNPRQPKFRDLADLDKQTREYGFITALHYYTKDNNTILEDAKKIRGLGIEGSLLQFNTLPPKVEILTKIKSYGFRSILKIAIADKSKDGGYKVWKGDEVEDVSTGSVFNLFNTVYERKDAISYIMFDPSHGNNMELDLNEASLAICFGKKIIENESLKHLGLIYAGGIRPNNVKQVTQTLNSFFPKRISIDTEGGVRTDNQLDLELVRAYLIGCKQVYSE